MADSRILFLYTLKFPQGVHEAFLRPELPYLSEGYDEVHIFPWTQVDEPIISLPENVSVHFTSSPESKPSFGDRLRLLAPNLGRKNYLKKLRYQVAESGGLSQRASALAPFLTSDKSIHHYSYWCADWATVLGLLTAKYAGLSYVSRIHGFDLYDERQSIGYHPYRSVQLKGLKRLYPVSDMGADYLRNRLAYSAIERSYLGTEDHGLGPKPKDDRLQLVSIARMVSLKRIPEIIEILKHCDEPVHWTHIGDGPEMVLLKTGLSVLPDHVTVSLLGAQDHEWVMQNYQSQGYHAFISVSETEGLPVSMMEAMSFGIPVISTDVGGVSEIVNDSSGILIPAKLDHRSIARVLNDFTRSGMATAAYRAEVRGQWQANFSAAVNYPRFIKDMQSVLDV